MEAIEIAIIDGEKCIRSLGWTWEVDYDDETPGRYEYIKGDAWVSIAEIARLDECLIDSLGIEYESWTHLVDDLSPEELDEIEESLSLGAECADPDGIRAETPCGKYVLNW